MSATNNAAAAMSINEAYNTRDWEAAVNLCSPDAEFMNVATGETFRGPEGVRQFLQGWATAFPDSKVETTAVVADEHGAAMEFIGRGTHTGPLASPAGDIPPTGKRVETPFAQMLTFREGKITRAKLYFDISTMLRQLGLAPMQTEATAD